MGISYFNCDTCGVEMNDCACELSWTSCSGCDATYCENCVAGKWVACGCSGFEYCESCVSASQVCGCGKFSNPFQPARAEQAGAAAVVSSAPVERRYPEPKTRELSSDEKAQLRVRIERGDGDLYALASEFGCSPSQVAGVKAAMHR